MRGKVAATLLFIVTTRSGGPGAFRFTEVTKESGIEFVHVTGASGRKYMVETMGSGAAFFDYDADGDPDLYLVQGGALPGYSGTGPLEGALYRNDGSGRFLDVTASAGIELQSYGMGAAAADYDNDGDVDLFVSAFGADGLFRNNGDGSFTEVAERAGVSSPLWGASAAWTDLDGDGNVDLYVTHYVDFDFENNPDCSQRKGGDLLRSYCLPDAFSGVSDILYRNRGDGTFADVSREAGVALPEGKGLGVVAFDYDGDGRTDVYVANDTTPNFLFRNEGAMRFSEIAIEAGAAYDGDGNALAGMGVDAGDYDRDSDLDLFVTNFQSEPNTLYRNGGRGVFTDASFPAGVGRPSLSRLGFGASFVDLDNDSFLDLAVANGHVLDNAALLVEDASYAQMNQLLWNRDGVRFDEVTDAGPGFALVKVSRGLAVADVEGDGDLDLLFTNSGDRPDLLRNETEGGGMLRLLLVGRRANRDGVGARLSVDLGEGKTMATELRAGSSYLSQSELVVHFGLGARESVPRVHVLWPGSSEEEIGPLPSNVTAVVVEGEGVIASWKTGKR